MAKRIIEKYISDLSGVELPDNASSLRFSFDGKSYEIDLTDSEREHFEAAIKPFIAVARPAAGRGRSKAASGPDPKVVREWARMHGHAVPDRGRIPANIMDAYNDAN